MIVFEGTKVRNAQTFMIYSNEDGSASVSIPVSEETAEFFLLHFDRLAPGTKEVEGSGDEQM